MANLYKFKCQKGLSLVEIILAIALFSLFSVPLIFMLINSYGSNFQAEEREVAVFYAQQGIEAVRSIRRQGWNFLQNGEFGLDKSFGHWQFTIPPDLLDGKYSRVIMIENICRDLGGNIADCTQPEVEIDLYSKRVISKVEYDSINGFSNQIQLESYITSWQSRDWTQIDWVFGPGQSVWNNERRYDYDDSNIEYNISGQISLKSFFSDGCGTKSWLFDQKDDYEYDEGKIEIVDSNVKLRPEGVCTGTPTDCLHFMSQQSCQDQSGCNWLGSHCTNSATASCSGIPPGLCSRCNAAGCIRQGGNCIGTIDCFSFPDQNSCVNCNQCQWIASSSCSGIPLNCDFFDEQSSCLNQSGCNWLESYSSDSPEVSPKEAYLVSGINNWTSFFETADKGGGEIYYQISDGADWYYYDGDWVLAGVDNYNLASDVNDNISTFPTSTSQINFKAFLSGDGTQQVMLDEIKISCAKIYDWPFSEQQDYIYDPTKIQVNNNMAFFVDQGISGTCSGAADDCSSFSTPPLCLDQAGCTWLVGTLGSTLNPSFDANFNNWNFSAWETPNQVDGNWLATGGNPNGYINIRIRGQRNRLISGYWQQSFEISVADLNGSLNFDWRVPTYFSFGLTSFYLYVFVETENGAPNLADYVWQSPLITGTTNWIRISNLDISSKIKDPGTYYLKLAVLGTYNNNLFSFLSTAIGAFDNVLLNWSEPSSCFGTSDNCGNYLTEVLCSSQSGCSWITSGSYSADSPSIHPVNSLTISGLEGWSSLVETADKNGGEIYYQLSGDNGLSWQYWSGSSWVNAGGDNYNTAEVINSNISSYPTTTSQIVFKAFLAGNGSQQIQLRNVRIGWGQSSGNGGYATFGYFVSSAYNAAAPSSFNIIEWDEIIPSCNPSCNIKMQIQTAPDLAGVPGSWSDWYGEFGSGSYFTESLGTIIPAELNFNQWIRYRAELAGDGNNTPILEKVKINYTP